MFDSPEAAATLELEGEVLADFVGDAIDAAKAHAAEFQLNVKRLLDLGSGPGVGTCEWAEAFPSAMVTAVDESRIMLDRAEARSARLGVGGRVVTRQLDLAGDLSVLGRHDVVVASMALHHVGDEASALVAIRDLLEPNGLLVIIERADPTQVTFVDDSPATVALWRRVNDAWLEWFNDMRAALPGATASSDYPAMFDTAGYEVLEDRVLAIELLAPLSPPARTFARARMERSESALADYTDQETLVAVRRLLDDLDGAGSHRWEAAEVIAKQRLLIGRAR